MDFRERMQTIGRIALLLFILASAAFLSAITAMRIAIRGRDVDMPALVGKNVADAQLTLKQHGLGMKVEDRIYSSSTVDTIVRQSPPAGTHVKVGQYIHVALSLGQREATIPNLVNKSLRASQIELLRSGLEVGEVSSAYFDSTPADVVMLQYPPSGTGEVESTRVNLLVSMGPPPEQYLMPQLQGLLLADAEKKISSAGMRMGKIVFVPIGNYVHSTVVSESPLAGSHVDHGTQIDLQVAE
jgi:beta-lactam-binding protein with PASTA domain